MHHVGSTANDFAWADGSTASGYTAWESGEPSSDAQQCGFIGGSSVGWSDADCAVQKAALCMLPQGTTVTVSLPPAVTHPPATESNVMSVLYAPPVPTIKRAAGQASVSNEPVMTFTADFTQAVVGLTVEDFLVFAGGMRVTKALAGAGRSYTITVTVETSVCVTPEEPQSCPDGYAHSASLGLCARLTDVAMTWEDANAACSPFTLMVVRSAEEMDWLTPMLTAQAWYACSVWGRCRVVALTVGGHVLETPQDRPLQGPWYVAVGRREHPKRVHKLGAG